MGGRIPVSRWGRKWRAGAGAMAFSLAALGALSGAAAAQQSGADLRVRQVDEDG
jgi:hypothetical protein